MLDFLPGASVFPGTRIRGVTAREGRNPLADTSYSTCSRARSSRMPCSGRIAKIAILTPLSEGSKPAQDGPGWAHSGLSISVK